MNKKLLDVFLERNIILDEVFLSKFDDEDKCFLLYLDGDTDDETIFIAVNHNDEKEVYFFKYDKPFKEIEEKHKEDILKYTLGDNHEWGEICASDIFVHGEHIIEIKNPYN